MDRTWNNIVCKDIRQVYFILLRCSNGKKVQVKVKNCLELNSLKKGQ